MHDGGLSYYEVMCRCCPGPANLFIEEGSAGPLRALRFDHPAHHLDPRFDDGSTLSVRRLRHLLRPISTDGR